MLLSQAPNTVYKFTPKEFSALSGLLSPGLIDECLMDTGIVTLRKRHLPMEKAHSDPMTSPLKYENTNLIHLLKEDYSAMCSTSLLRFIVTREEYVIKGGY